MIPRVVRAGLVSFFVASSPAAGQARNPPKPAAAPVSAADSAKSGFPLGGLKFRSVGPAVTGGRIGEVVVDPMDPRIWYVVAHAGGVWKTANAGTTWTPVFDEQNAYSIGALAVDPKNPLTVWVGTGENNSQRSTGYGDGIYKSTDGGKSWSNIGLKTSNHIGRIVIDPRKPEVVYATAMGSLWSAGGDRGVFKTVDAGKTWTQVLKPDNEWTGAYALDLDPRNPDVLYATTYQRVRRQWGFIDGGPGSAVYKSVDAGATWTKLTKGLPSDELGKVGLAVSAADPNVVYAIVEAANRAGGVFRSVDQGQSWERMNPTSNSSPMYYAKIYADPKKADRVYLMDVRLTVSDDGGRTFRSIQGRSTHVDNHAVWIDPADPRHLLNGNDGGLYETFDSGATWNFRSNLPITQFYRVDVDNALPFYTICGGTQDNASLCGPSATVNEHGATNFDWFVIVGGDGFQARIDPEDPNTIYGQWQHGELVRFDRRTGERVEIQPQPDAGEALRWHWDSPLMISPHAHTRLYFGSQRLFRSDDRGDSWRAVSGDLSRHIDRNRLRLMGRVWGPDAVAKNTSTSLFGTIVSVAESPKQEGLLYVGTDDGLVQVSEDGGATWRAIASFPGVPDTTFVSDLEPSHHDPNVVYATFNNHKAGDFKPYVLRSADRGRTWASIASNLPARGSVWTIAEDHVDPKLLFAGTEFGVFVTTDGGAKWTQLKAGLPTIAIRDMAIQARENDLVLASFGRGFYVLDDYSPLRHAGELAGKTAALLPVKDARMFVQASPLGGGPRGSQGDGLWTAKNPSFGAVFTYYLKEDLKTRKARRQAAEKDSTKKNADVAYPAWDDLRKEDREEAPAVVLTVTDESGALVRRLTGPTTAGFQRVAWDLRYPATVPLTGAAAPPAADDDDGPNGPMVVPGTYRVAMALRIDGVESPVGEPVVFRAVPIGPVPPGDRAPVTAFHRQTARLQRAALGAGSALGEIETRLKLLTQAIDATPKAPGSLRDSAGVLTQRLAALRTSFSGDQTIAGRQESTPPTLLSRIQRIVGGTWSNTSAPTATHRRSYDIVDQELRAFMPKLSAAAEDLRKLEDAAEAAGAPWTPGRIPRWP